MAFDVVDLEYGGHAMLHDQAHSFDGGKYLRPMGVVGVDVSHGHNGGAHDYCDLHSDHSTLLSSWIWLTLDRSPPPQHRRYDRSAVRLQSLGRAAPRQVSSRRKELVWESKSSAALGRRVVPPPSRARRLLRPDVSASSGTSIVGRNGSPVEGGQREGTVVEESIDGLEIELWLFKIGDMAGVRDHTQAG